MFRRVSHSGRTFQKRFWRCMILSTLVMCSVLLCISYVFRGSINTTENQAVAEKQTQNCRKECLSKECIQLARYLAESVDNKIDPCDNFYSFACGKWIERTGKEENRSTFEIMKSNIKIKLANLIDKLHDSEDDLAIKLRTIFDSCMSFDGSEINVSPTVVDFLNRLGLGDWPNLAEDFLFTNPSFEETLGILDSYDEFSFFRFRSKWKDKNSSDCDPDCLDIMIVDFSRPLVRKVTQMDLYENVVKKILGYYRLQEDEVFKIWEDFKSVDSEIVIFEEALVEKIESQGRNKTDSTNTSLPHQTKAPKNATESESDDENPTYMCLPESTEILKFICRLLKHFLSHAGLEKNFSSENVTMYEEMILQIQPLLLKFNHRTLANYLVLRFFIKHVKEMNLFFRSTTLPEDKNRRSMYDNFLGKIIQSQREHCAAWLAIYMTQPLAALFMSESLPKNETDDINILFEELQNKAVDYSLQQEWIGKNETETEKFIEFVKDMTLNAKNDVMRNLSIFTEDLQPKRDNFFWNVLELQKEKRKFILLRYQRIYISDGSFDVNAAYGGDITLKFGILFPPVYQFGRPKLMNLASLGFVIMHEIGHGITRYLAAESKDNQTKESYKEIEKCLKTQYSEFILEKIDKKVNGEKTFMENIADVIAVQMMDKYVEVLVLQNEESLTIRLPSLPFSLDQLMYLLLAQVFCESRSKEKEEEQYKKDVHSAEYIRMNGIARNSDGFRKAFKCKPGSNMSPLKKCSVYT